MYREHFKSVFSINKCDLIYLILASFREEIVMSDEQQKMFEIYLQEYSKLKDEQAQRIGFRDNLLYVTLALFGTVLAFALGEKANPYALLVLPWVSLVLGWTYVVNDQKISALGRYIRHENTGGE